MPLPPDPLDSLLNRWKTPDGPIPNLEPEVWSRVRELERTRSQGFWQEIDAWLSRPPFAALFVACCALLGLFLAEVRINRVQRDRNTQLARSYLQLIDPLLKSEAPPKLP
jgi:hypothetical protein